MGALGAWCPHLMEEKKGQPRLTRGIPARDSSAGLEAVGGGRTEGLPFRHRTGLMAREEMPARGQRLGGNFNTSVRASRWILVTTWGNKKGLWRRAELQAV